MPEREWLTKLEAAEYARVSRATIDRMMKSGELKYSKVGKKVIIRRRLVDRWLESKTVKPTPGKRKS